MSEYRAFQLSPGQQAPEGSTGQGLTSGEILWIGDPENFPYSIQSRVLTLPEIYQWHADQFTIAIQNHLDATAKAKGYDSIISACTYATSTDPVFSAEGQACVAWRDAVWRACYEMMTNITTNQLSIPTEAEVITALPAMVWP